MGMVIRIHVHIQPTVKSCFSPARGTKLKSTWRVFGCAPMCEEFAHGDTKRCQLRLFRIISPTSKQSMTCELGEVRWPQVIFVRFCICVPPLNDHWWIVKGSVDYLFQESARNPTQVKISTSAVQEGESPRKDDLERKKEFSFYLNSVRRVLASAVAECFYKTPIWVWGNLVTVYFVLKIRIFVKCFYLRFTFLSITGPTCCVEVFSLTGVRSPCVATMFDLTVSHLLPNRGHPC